MRPVSGSTSTSTTWVAKLGPAFSALNSQCPAIGPPVLGAFAAISRKVSGGKAPAIREPLVGALRVAKALIGWRKLAIERDVTYRTATVNGEPGFVYYWPDGSVAGVQELEIADGVVIAVRSVLNPDKLAHLATG